MKEVTEHEIAGSINPSMMRNPLFFSASVLGQVPPIVGVLFDFDAKQIYPFVSLTIAFTSPTVVGTPI
jgi:hypothetical protein